jgi:hypothetical protein
MKLKLLQPKQALNKAFLKQRPLRGDIDLFKTNLINLLSKIDEIEREENQKNHIRDFLRDTFYKQTNEVNTKGSQDLVIHTGKDNKSTVGVIIEAKRPSNKAEWLTADKPNSKALHELVLYYMRERIEANNIDIKYLVATNIYEWYIIEASYFEKLFYRNKQFVTQYEEWRDGRKVTKDTNLFYNDIVKPFINKLTDEIPCVYFDIRDYEKSLKNTNKIDDKNLIALQKILSPFHLLKVPFTNDSNSLNERFYRELLHIIGLEEAKENGKNIIRRKEKDRNAGSLIENTISVLETEDPFHKIPDLSVYGENKEDRLFNIALELTIIWINRILFLKLLEGQLVIYHNGDKQYRFLSNETINDFDELFKLFHKVLAVNHKDRTPAIQQKYSRVPYLNSSLFDIESGGLEDLTIKINSLDNSETLELISNTVLKDIKKKKEKIQTLDYLFKFLDAYDFASEGTEDIQEDNKTLINASVLGKVFEKINGYKDGSIFTPGFITMYMCRQSIRLAVIKKFQEKYRWNIEQIEDIKNYTADRKGSKDILEFNAVINSLHICDPAVGSGHFLVSALNELIAIKSELGILADEKGVRLTEYEIEISHDELFVTDHNGDIFEYQLQNGRPKSKEAQRLQKSLFHEKQSLIENCLFGVDINPNSVKICRLRLWIELLKNAYYKEETNFAELETLPNIDINIKCGNSLLNRFPLDADLSKALKSIKYNIEQYRGFVNDYKNERNRDIKRGLQKIIDTIKSDFKTEIFNNDPKVVRLNKIGGELFNLLNQTKLFDEDAKQKKVRKEKQQKYEAEIKKLTKEIEEIKTNAIYKNAFEWRFEFPEVLNNNGDFEGFDIIIGNPPYISAIDLKKSLSELAYKQLKLDYQTAKGTVDLFIYFFERGLKLIKSNAILTFITPNRYLSVSYGEALREYLYKQAQITEIIDYSHVKVFEEASTYPIVTSLIKTETNGKEYPIIVGKYDTVADNIVIKNVTSVKLNFLEGYIWGYLLNDKIQITEKVISQSVSITHCATINATSTASEADEYHNLINEKSGFKLVNTGTIDRYESLWGKETLTDKGKRFLKPYLPKDNNLISDNRRNLYNSPKIVLAKIAIRVEAFLDSKGEYASINTNCLHTFNDDFDSKYILAWLNSKLFQYTFECFFEGLKMQGGYLLYSSPNVSKMSIKKIPKKEQQMFIDLVEDILEIKKQKKDSSFLERKIDAMFYKLYNLNNSECITIEQNLLKLERNKSVITV